MPPQGQTQGRYYGESAAHRRQLRAAIKILAKQAQLWRAKVREFEEACERIRDRSTIPTPEQANSQLATRWQNAWNQLKATEKSLADYLSMFV